MAAPLNALQMKASDSCKIQAQISFSRNFAAAALISLALKSIGSLPCRPEFTPGMIQLFCMKRGKDVFEELQGRGILPGVDGLWMWAPSRKAARLEEQIILIDTAGIRQGSRPDVGMSEKNRY